MNPIHIKPPKTTDFLGKFKNFALRDGIIEMAIGVIIGSSFSKVVSSLVKDIIMPPLGILLGGVHLAHYRIVLREALHDSHGHITEKAVTFNIGKFAETAIDFLIISTALFLVYKLFNRLKTNQVFEFLAAKPDVVKPEQLLADIKNILVTIERNTSTTDKQVSHSDTRKEI